MLTQYGQHVSLASEHRHVILQIPLVANQPLNQSRMLKQEAFTQVSKPPDKFDNQFLILGLFVSLSVWYVCLFFCFVLFVCLFCLVLFGLFDLFVCLVCLICLFVWFV